MKSIFILGASRLQVPAIKKAKERGLYVYVLDYDPDAIGIQFADKFLNISTIDKEAVLEAALIYKPDYIITSTSDMPVRTVSWVCEKLNKETDISYEGAICATDKIAMRNRMKKCGIPIPEFHEINSDVEFQDVVKKMPDKFVLKPADNAASRGVIFIDKNKFPDFNEIYKYCRNYSRSGKILAEEYMEGKEVSVETFTVDGEPHVIAITDKIVTDLPFFVELGHIEPSRMSAKQLKDICEVAYDAIKAIGMKNGPNHTEIKMTSSGPKLVEIAARLGGDFITSRLVPLSTGVDMIDCSFSTLLGDTVDYNNKFNRGAAILFIQGKEGIISSIEGIDEAKSIEGIYEIELYKKSGDYIKSPENSSDRVGHIIACGNDANEAETKANEALRRIKIIYK